MAIKKKGGTSGGSEKKTAAASKTLKASSKPARKKKPAEDRSKKIALAIADAAIDRKALNVEIIDVQGKVDYADFIVVMSGRSDRQVSSLARHLEEDLLQKMKVRCLSVEGVSQGQWVLMDFGDVIVHIFHEDARGYYDLESLWMDAGRVEVAASDY